MRPGDLPPTRTGKFRWAAFADAMRGLGHVFTTQPNARFHVWAALAAVLLASGLHFAAGEWAVLCLSITLVWVSEVVNTALESVVDLASPEIHPLARYAKDAAAGAVLLAAVSSIIIGLLLFVPKLWRWFADMSGPHHG